MDIKGRLATRSCLASCANGALDLGLALTPSSLTAVSSASRGPDRGIFHGSTTGGRREHLKPPTKFRFPEAVRALLDAATGGSWH
jgi:hypothetical protein